MPAGPHRSPTLRDRVLALLAEHLGLAPEDLDKKTPFVELGLSSRRAVELVGVLEDELGEKLSPTLLWDHPTVDELLAHLTGATDAPARDLAAPTTGHRIAIIGLSCRLPGAADPAAFLELLRAGKEGVGPVPPGRWGRPHPKVRGGFLDEAFAFDGAFFGMTPAEVAATDPQQRLLLELGWEALEDAGLVPGALAKTRTGVFVGISHSEFGARTLGDPTRLISAHAATGSALAVAANRLSYFFDLLGPSVAVDTACSSSLVATHLACQALASGAATLALVGGVSLLLGPELTEHFSALGLISPDGRCRAYDAKAQGYPRGEGGAMFVLKPEEAALRDGDRIYAVIRGGAVRHGGRTNGLLAPSREGQVQLLREAYAQAQLPPGRVQYVEGHGTGTKVGDSVELQALGEALLDVGERAAPCRLGSVKSNLGHLEAAAGAAGLLKATLGLYHRQLFPSLHFEAAPLGLNLDELGLSVQTRCELWPPGEGPPVAGVSSFGFGGTIAHLVLEGAKAPEVAPGKAEPEPRLVCWSTASEGLLDAAGKALAGALSEGAPLEDLAATLVHRRTAHRHRRAFVAVDAPSAARALRGEGKGPLLQGAAEGRELVFLFGGLGDQYPGMARGLYRRFDAFRRAFDRCAEVLLPQGLDLRALLGADGDAPARKFDGPDLRRMLGRDESSPGPLDATAVAHPMVFAVEYALAQLLLELGLRPTALLGHSLGEWVAACVGGVFELDAALSLVARRAKLVQEAVSPGAMLSAFVAESELPRYRTEGVSVAALNAPQAVVFSGQEAAVAELAERLRRDKVAFRKVGSAQAFHSPALGPVGKTLTAWVAELPRQVPRIPLLSNLTGTWLRPDEAVDPSYWARQQESPVQFSRAVAQLWRRPGPQALVEVGAGRALSSFALQHPGCSTSPAPVVAAPLRAGWDAGGDDEHLLRALGQLWCHGVDVDWALVQPRRRVVSLAPCAFDRAPGAAPTEAGAAPTATEDEVLYLPGWKSAPAPVAAVGQAPRSWLLCFDGGEARQEELVKWLSARGDKVTVVTPGPTPWTGSPVGNVQRARLPLADEGAYEALWRELAQTSRLPDELVLAWQDEGAGEAQRLLPWMGWARALGRAVHTRPLRVTALTSQGLVVGADEEPLAHRALALGPARVWAQESPNVVGRVLDVEAWSSRSPAEWVAELEANESEVALRGRARWVRSFEPFTEPQGPSLLRPEGTYVLIGGLGEIGLLLADFLARRAGARLMLTSRGSAHSPERAARLRQRLEALRPFASAVRTMDCEVSSPASLRAVFERAEKELGEVRGVVHLAGLVAERHFQPLAQLTLADVERHFLPKVRGLVELEGVVRERRLDFALALSSLSAVLGGLGFGAYAAANAYMDAAVARFNRRAAAEGLPTPWLALDWDGELEPERAEQVFDRLFSPHVFGRLDRLVVSSRPLLPRLRTWVEKAPSAGPSLRRPRPTEARPFAAPASAVERAVCSLVGELLGLDGVGLDDGFFALGGNSLVATQLLARLRQRYEVDLPLRELFDRPTPRELSRALERLLAEKDATGPAPSDSARPAPGGAQLEAPLSFEQERLWFLHQLHPGLTAYHMPLGIVFEGALDEGALSSAFARLIERHDALRTFFPAREGRPFQRVAPLAEVPRLRPVAPPEVLLEGAKGANPDEVCRALLGQLSQEPFRLDQPFLWRAALFRLSPRRHLLAFVVHHAVFDAWSVGVFRRELEALYREARSGVSARLPPLTKRFVDFAQEQRAGSQEASLASWRRALAGASEHLALPFDRPAGPHSGKGARVPLALPKALERELRAFAERRGCTPFMVLLAGFAALLQRWSGQADFCVGTPVSLRKEPALEPLVGFLVNTVPLRFSLLSSTTFEALLEQTRERTLEALARPDAPLERLVEERREKRRLGQNPLFQVLFAYQNVSLPALDFPGVSAHGLAGDGQAAMLDLFLSLAEGDQGLTGFLEYATDRFERPTIASMACSFEHLFAHALREPTASLEALELLGPSEAAALAERLRGPDLPDEPPPLHQAIFQRAARCPQEVAVAQGDEELTYQALAASARQLAATLRDKGVGPGDRVAVLLPRSPRMVAALLGVLEAGAAYVPLDPEFPPERLSFMLADCRPRLVLTQEGALKDAGARGEVREAAGASWLDLGAAWAGRGSERHASARSEDAAAGDSPSARTDAVAYVLYTSGSSGRPKGVEVPHRALANFWRAMVDVVGLGERDVMLAATTLCFDISVLELLVPLAVGARVELASADEARDGVRLLRRLAASKATVFQATPTSWRLLCEAEALEGSCVLRDVRALCGGEALSPDLAAQLLERCREVWNLYGPTETTVWSTAARLERPPAGHSRFVPLGRPLARTTLRVLDERLRPVPSGMPGELCIGGDGLARGYLGRPDETAARFVNVPDGERLYRTGDRVRCHGGGELEFLGRLDDQVKVRGFRIELGEVEHVLKETPGVADAVVVAQPASLVAYLRTRRSEANLEGEQLEAWASVWDETYRRTDFIARDPSFDTVGWVSSETGLPVPPHEMREWVDETLARLRVLSPHRVLEVGCGTGLLTLPLAEQAEAITAVDLSGPALEELGAELARRAHRHVQLHRAAAHEVAALLYSSKQGPFDCLVLNSVVQYFPSGRYLLAVLEALAPFVAPRGTMFLGDLRNAELLEAQHLRRLLAKSPDALLLSTLERRLAQGVRREQELAVSPWLWRDLEARTGPSTRLARFRRADVRPRHGACDTEMNRFRYDVVLHAGGDDGAPHFAGERAVRCATEREFSQLGSLDALGAWLRASPAVPLRVRDVPNARVNRAVRAVDALRQLAPRGADVEALHRFLDSAPASGEVEPERLRRLDERFSVELEWSGRSDCLHALFLPRAGSEAAPHLVEPAAEKPPAGCAWWNEPLSARAERHVLEAARKRLEERLPDYMRPASLVVLEEFPRLPNGKVNRRALPPPDEDRRDATSPWVGPRNQAEERLARLFGDALGLERVGVHDDFFQLGGASLAVIQLVSKARAAGLQLEPAQVFERPTVAELALALTEEKP